jgi:hypothetical protein
LWVCSKLRTAGTNIHEILYWRVLLTFALASFGRVGQQCLPLCVKTGVLGEGSVTEDVVGRAGRKVVRTRHILYIVCTFPHFFVFRCKKYGGCGLRREAV